MSQAKRQSKAQRYSLLEDLSPSQKRTVAIIAILAVMIAVAVGTFALLSAIDYGGYRARAHRAALEAFLFGGWNIDEPFTAGDSGDLPCDFYPFDPNIHNFDDYSDTPLIINAATFDWPARQKWTKHAFLDNYGDQTVHFGAEATAALSEKASRVSIPIKVDDFVKAMYYFDPETGDFTEHYRELLAQEAAAVAQEPVGTTIDPRKNDEFNRISKSEQSNDFASEPSPSTLPGSSSMDSRTGAAALPDHPEISKVVQELINARNDLFIFDSASMMDPTSDLKKDIKVPRMFRRWDNPMQERQGKVWHMLSVGPSRSGTWTIYITLLLFAHTYML